MRAFTAYENKNVGSDRNATYVHVHSICNCGTKLNMFFLPNVLYVLAELKIFHQRVLHPSVSISTCQGCVLDRTHHLSSLVGDLRVRIKLTPLCPVCK